MLTRDGAIINVTPKVFELLCYLAGNSGRLITREELMRTLWPESFVEESNLTVSVSMLRKALDDQSGLVQTVPKQGYRFLGEVQRIGAAAAVIEPPLAVEPVPAAPPPAPRRSLVWIGAAAVALGIAIAGLRLYDRPIPSPSQLRVVPLTAFPGLEYDATISPDGTRVAYTSEPPLAVFVLQIPNGEPVRVSPPGVSAVKPAWSPDGTQMAYISITNKQYSIDVAPVLGGGQPRKLFQYGRPPFHTSYFGPQLQWSPDGQWILFAAEAGNYSTYIAAVSVVSGEVHRVTDPPITLTGDQHAALSADGQTLVFSRNVTTVVGDYYAMRVTPQLKPASEAKRISFFNAACGGVTWIPGTRDVVVASGPFPLSALHRVSVSTDLTAGAAQPANFSSEQATGPSVSAASPTTPSRLVFERINHDVNIRRMPVPAGLAAGQEGDLWGSSTRMEQTPAFSPDGARVAFASTRSGAWEVWVCDNTGRNCAQITHLGKSFNRSPAWSPDGKRIVFDSRVGGQSDLFVVSSDGGAVVQLTDTSINETAPSWSHDGKFIYFQSNEKGEYDIWRIPAGGGRREQLTDLGGVYQPKESTDGRWLYFKNGHHDSLMRMALPDGPAREFVSGLVRAFALTKDAVFVQMPSSLERVDLASGARSVLARFETGKMDPNGLAASPDGKSLLYLTMDSYTSDLFLVDNFR